MYPQYPAYQPYQRQDYIPSNIPGLLQTPSQPIVRPVASRAEAEVSQAPFDGTPAYFENKAAGEMYKKAFLPDGTAPLETYKKVTEQPVQYVTVEQFNALVEEIEKLKRPKGRAVKDEE